jgi:hypothetical protein
MDEVKEAGSPAESGATGVLEQDERWALIQRMASSATFRNSVRLRQFLLYVAERSLAGRTQEIKEHEIGWNVFGRREDYNTLEDSIVRSAARQLRKKVADYYASEGQGELWQVEIPKGHYQVVFTRRDAEVAGGQVPANSSHPTPQLKVVRVWQGVSVVLAIALVFLVVSRFKARTEREVSKPGATRTITATMFDGGQPTKIILGDYGAVLMSVVSGVSFSAEDYANRRYPDSLVAQSNATPWREMWDGLTNGHAVFFFDTLIAADIVRLSAQNGWNVPIQQARQVTVQDFRTGNVILIGSTTASPWTNLIADKLNFRYHVWVQEVPRMLEFLNTHPLPGEQARYAADRGAPNVGVTYGLVARVPNLAGTGKILLIQGLRSPGALAAGDFATSSNGLTQLLQKLKVADDRALPDFEALLQTDSIATSHADTRVVAVRNLDQ